MASASRVVAFRTFCTDPLEFVALRLRKGRRELEAKGQLIPHMLHPPIVIVPVERWNPATQKALRFAMTLSPEVQAVHVACDQDDSITTEWQSVVEQPARKAGAPVAKLVTLRSPYRMVLHPIVNYVLQVEKENSHRMIALRFQPW